MEAKKIEDQHLLIQTKLIENILFHVEVKSVEVPSAEHQRLPLEKYIDNNLPVRFEV